MFVTVRESSTGSSRAECSERAREVVRGAQRVESRIGKFEVMRSVWAFLPTICVLF